MEHFSQMDSRRAARLQAVDATLSAGEAIANIGEQALPLVQDLVRISSFFVQTAENGVMLMAGTLNILSPMGKTFLYLLAFVSSPAVLAFSAYSACTLIVMTAAFFLSEAIFVLVGLAFLMPSLLVIALLAGSLAVILLGMVTIYDVWIYGKPVLPKSQH